MVISFDSNGAISPVHVAVFAVPLMSMLNVASVSVLSLLFLSVASKKLSPHLPPIGMVGAESSAASGLS